MILSRLTIYSLRGDFSMSHRYSFAAPLVLSVVCAGFFATPAFAQVNKSNATASKSATNTEKAMPVKMTKIEYKQGDTVLEGVLYTPAT